MTESLLSFSNIDLFGHVIADLEIVEPEDRRRVRVASTDEIGALSGNPIIDGVKLKRKDLIIVWKQATTPTQNGLYKVKGPAQNWTKQPIDVGDRCLTGIKGKQYSNTLFVYSAADTFTIDESFDGRFSAREGENKQLELQLKDSCFARIYGFSFEGVYYDLPRPTLFLVHGEGQLVSEAPPATGSAPNRFRAPGNTSLTGVAAAGFDFADGLRVWSYDKADYTIRMDVENGMFEQVLLDAMFDGGGPGGIESSGMNARGMNARGMNARGMNARGMNARGMNARGMNARGNSD